MNSTVREVQFAPPAVNEDVSLMLEEWLQRVRAGEVQAVGVCGVKRNGQVSTEWRGVDRGWLHQMLSAVSILQFRILRMNCEPE